MSEDNRTTERNLMQPTTPKRNAEPAPAITAPVRRIGTGTANGKAILLGEHAVVYGAPAIAMPLLDLEVEADLRPVAGGGLRLESDLFAGTSESAPEHMRPVTTAVRSALTALDIDDHRVQVRIRSGIPHGLGLGSSAAVATAVARAAADYAGIILEADQLHAIVQQAERVAHGNPSGIDARTVASDGPIRFQDGIVTPVHVGAPLAFVLADSGTPGSTAEAVGGVRERLAADPEGIGEHLDRLAQLADGASLDLRIGDREALGARMTEAHSRLGRIGVSSPALDGLVDAAIAAGAFGAKLTGGGLGGCVLALASCDSTAEHISLALRAAGAKRTWTTTVPAA